MAAPVVAQLSDLTERALLILILERQTNMSADITALQNTVAALQAAQASFAPVLQANTDVTNKAIGIIESLVTQIQNATPTQASIDALQASAAKSLADLQTDSASVAAQNAALQAELDKVSPPTP